MKFGFIGGTPRGYSLFKELISHGHKPEFCIILKEDDHENVKVSPDFLQEANKNSIHSEIKKKLEQKDYDLIKSEKLDFIIVCGWRTIIEIEINSYLKLGLIAAHDSLLPGYRGFAPLNWAIINGEKKTGVTLFVINDKEVDSGDIILQEEVDISENDYAIDVYQKVINATNNCYLKFIENFIGGKAINLIKQDESEDTYTCKRTPEDGRINWMESSLKIYNLIRALAYPYSGAFFFHNEKKYEIRTACIGDYNFRNFSGRIPGRVISVSDNGVEVMCGVGTIMMKELFDVNSGSVMHANQLFKSITIKLQ